MARRLTKAEKQAKWDAAYARVWEGFRDRLAAAQNFVHAGLLVRSAPSPSTPGHQYYSNLGTLLQSFVVPNGSSPEERRLYIALIERLNATGVLKPGVGQRVVEALRRARGE
jgi:hypothetical protein